MKRIQVNRDIRLPTVASPRARTTVASPRARTTVASPRARTTVARTTVAPPRARTTVASPRARTTVAPPRARTTVAPPRARTTVAPPRARTTVAPAAEVYDTHNINLLPNEIQYFILDNLDLEELRKIYHKIVDPAVRRYAGELGEKISNYRNKGILKLALEGDLEGVEWLHLHGDDISFEKYHHHKYGDSNSDYSSVLYNAIRSGNINLVEWLIDNGVNKVDRYTLAFAAELGNIDIVMLLAQRGKLDIKHPEVVNSAMYGRRYDLVKFLIDQGADPNDIELKSNALASGNQDIIDFLASRGALF